MTYKKPLELKSVSMVAEHQIPLGVHHDEKLYLAGGYAKIPQFMKKE